MIEKDVVIIGAGPAGMAAAVSAKESGIENLLLIERENKIGGILNQCIHDGFGLHNFRESLTGPEYIERYLSEIKRLNVDVMSNTMVVNLSKDRTLTVSNPNGRFRIKAKSVILAMGCRERTRGAISIPGSRPSGVFTAGVAQRLMNIQNYSVGKRVVILGSGDIGLIMARRLTLEGSKVLVVLEKLPFSSGLPRNITQCLEDFNIPLKLSHTVVKIHGKERISGVDYAKVDDSGRIIEGTMKHINCDTLLLSVGLIPENELSEEAGVVLDERTMGATVDDTYQTNIPGVFAAGNVLHVHDLADMASMEGKKVGIFASMYAKGEIKKQRLFDVIAGEGVRYVLPQKISTQRDVQLLLRVKTPIRNHYLVVKDANRLIKKRKVINMHPAVMLSIHLRAEELKDTKSQIEVCVE